MYEGIIINHKWDMPMGIFEICKTIYESTNHLYQPEDVFPSVIDLIEREIITIAELQMRDKIKFMIWEKPSLDSKNLTGR
ncbi:MAG: hypothetical protein ACTSU2_08985 [Promethearchaeota archaeon]